MRYAGPWTWGPIPLWLDPQSLAPRLLPRDSSKLQNPRPCFIGIVGDEFLTSISSLSAFDLRLNRGVSDFNIAQTLVIAGTWQVPGPDSLSGPLGWTAKR